MRDLHSHKICDFRLFLHDKPFCKHYSSLQYPTILALMLYIYINLLFVQKTEYERKNKEKIRVLKNKTFMEQNRSQIKGYTVYNR